MIRCSASDWASYMRARHPSVWPMALVLTLVCIVPPALMLAPPSSGAMLAVYAPGMSASDALQAAASAGARAAEPLAGGNLVRIDMPASADRRSAGMRLRENGAVLVIAPISSWACPPGTSVSRESRQ